MFRKEPSLITSWKEKDSSFYAPLQKEILKNAWTMLKPGGRLVYSTCTFAAEEDEEVIEDLMNCFNDAVIEESPLAVHFEKGVKAGFEKCMRLYPHKLNGEGHFAALLRKEGSSERNHVPSEGMKIRNTGFESFMKLIRDDSGQRYELIKDRIYRLPETSFDTRGIRTVRSGLYMGSVKNDRFEPSGALALSLKAEQFANVLSLEPDDIRTEKYLRGETIRDENTKDGWVLVCVSGYPLGFGKCSSHSIKNKLEKGCRKI
jgi:NOL1/NOP2/fmu family ribosome biogenesis protein